MRQQMSRLLSYSVMTLAFMPMAWAQPQSDVRNPTELSNQIDGTQAIIESQQRQLFADPLAGMIINRTVTVQGHDFYRFFATIWRAKGLDTHYTIAIYERPTARWGSEIWVEYRRQEMFHTFLPPARSQTRAISEYAVNLVFENLMDSEFERLLIHNPDLAPEEF